MQTKIELGDILTEDIFYTLHQINHKEQKLVALKIKRFVSDTALDIINTCKEQISRNADSSVLKIIDVIGGNGKALVIIENFSNTALELFTKNNMKLSQRDILNHSLELSASCVSLVNDGYFPKINFDTICFNHEGVLKLIPPHLL